MPNPEPLGTICATQPSIVGGVIGDAGIVPVAPGNMSVADGSSSAFVVDAAINTLIDCPVAVHEYSGEQAEVVPADSAQNCPLSWRFEGNSVTPIVKVGGKKDWSGVARPMGKSPTVTV
jgi:hypothetical protein